MKNSTIGGLNQNVSKDGGVITESMIFLSLYSAMYSIPNRFGCWRARNLGYLEALEDLDAEFSRDPEETEHNPPLTDAADRLVQDSGLDTEIHITGTATSCGFRNEHTEENDIDLRARSLVRDRLKLAGPLKFGQVTR
ncbi:hypothetical protein OCU04_009978 [Sclerotinia nivalis]|uniref:Uncharacterized protein n=1 Tax=Sclerotinia nivalis TaxID=352851 RepID=A0A9X0AH77_9HELO|nr:hypothetical protein OCU04_009978 [Sclerotinia nivalis]